MSANPSHLSTIQPSVGLETNRQAESRLLVVTTVVTLIALLNAIGLLIVLRRLAGALSDALPPDAMLLTALVAMATVAWSRLAWRRAFPLEKTATNNQNWDALVGWGSSLALILLAAGCCYPANHTSDWLIWLPMLVADQFWRQTFFDAGEPANTSEYDEELAAATLAFPREHERSEPIFESALLEGSQFHPPGNESDREEIVQQLFRVRDDGCEVIYGTVRADFTAGQRTAVVHVGFCPPLSHIPEIEAESLPGTTARIKIVQALAHGTRMDVRLPAPAETDRHIWIDMAATPREDYEEIQA